MAAKEQVVEIEGRQLKLSNLDKVLYPAAGFTKGQVIDYYVRVAPALLPHMRGRALTMKRYPDGVDGQFFYEKNCPKHRPPWVATASIWSDENQRFMEYCVAEDIPTLVWTSNLADLELHTSLARVEKTSQPTMVVFDLDPGEPANIVQCCRVALLLKELFERLGLESFPKTSGSKGLQIYLPLNTPSSYEETKPFAHALARLLESTHPDLVVSEMKKTSRTGKVFVDWNQNSESRTTVCIYSLRAKQRPTVSTPVSWDEVEQCSAKGDAGLLVFESHQVLDRVQRLGDLFAPVLELKQSLPDLQSPTTTATSEDKTEGSEPSPTPAKKKSSPKQKSTTTKQKSAAKEHTKQERA